MEKSQFKLKKIKIKNEGDIEIEFTVHDTIGSSHYEEEKKVKSTKFAHPDLTGVLMRFLPLYSSNLGYDHIRKMVNNPEFKATDKQVKYAETQYQFMLEKLKVKGVAFSSDQESVKILGTNSLNGQVIAANSTPLRTTTEYGYEEELQQFQEELIDEAYKFIFEGKVANPELFD